MDLLKRLFSREKKEKRSGDLSENELKLLSKLREEARNHDGSLNKKAAEEYIKRAEIYIKKGRDLGTEKYWYASISSKLQK